MKTTVVGYAVFQSGKQITKPFRDFAAARAELQLLRSQRKLFLSLVQVPMTVEASE